MRKSALLLKREEARKKAMPEVKRLVKKFGRATIANCLGRLREHERAAQKLAALKSEVARLERRA